MQYSFHKVIYNTSLRNTIGGDLLYVKVLFMMSFAKNIVAAAMVSPPIFDLVLSVLCNLLSINILVNHWWGNLPTNDCLFYCLSVDYISRDKYMFAE